MTTRLKFPTLVVSIALGTIHLSAYSQDSRFNPFDMNLESLMNVEVYSPGKELTKIMDAPAVITVITQNEIRNRGLKTLKQVLDRVPGFFTAPDESTYLIANRGYTQNPNTNYLILYDNQPLNNQRLAGAEEYMLFPSLFQVKRIEVIRGPGSTLWGADAAMGIINIIPYSAADLLDSQKDSTVTMDMDLDPLGHNRTINMLAAGHVNSDIDGLFSITMGNADPSWSNIYSIGSTGVKLNDRQMDAYHNYDSSYEINGSLKRKDLKLSARVFHFENYGTSGTSNNITGYPGLSTASTKNTFNWFARADYNTQLTSDIKFDVSYSHGSYEAIATLNDLQVLPQSLSHRLTYYYDDDSVDSMLTYKLDSNTIKIGLQYTRRDFSDRPLLTYSDPTIIQNSYINTLRGIENARGIFVEDEYRPNKDVILTAGLRYDENDFRLPGSYTYPRFAAIYKSSDKTSVKYSYNRGYVRPTIERSDGSFQNLVVINNRAYIGPTAPQTATSQDLQFNYNGEALQGSITLYTYIIENYIARVGYEPGATFNGYLIRYQNQNIASIEGRGIELDASYSFTDNFKLYGNLAIAEANFSSLDNPVAGGLSTFNLVSNSTYANPDTSTTGVPKIIWNLGFDWHLSNDEFLNVHARGWSKDSGKIGTNSTFQEFGDEQLLDLAYTHKNWIQRNLSVTIYGKNILQRQVKYPQAPHGGYIQEPDSQLGVRLHYIFD